MKLTAIIEKGDDGWWVGQIAEFPAALAQGHTVDEVKASLHEALHLLLDSQRELTLEQYESSVGTFSLEPLLFTNETQRLTQAS